VIERGVLLFLILAFVILAFVSVAERFSLFPTLFASFGDEQLVQEIITATSYNKFDRTYPTVNLVGSCTWLAMSQMSGCALVLRFPYTSIDSFALEVLGLARVAG